MHHDPDDARHSDPLNQNQVPDAFVALHTEPGRAKPSLSRSELLERYTLCEDMAQMLAEHAATLQFSHDLSEAETLRRMLQGLLARGELAQAGQLRPMEALWVVCRLAESLNWPLPALLAQDMEEQARHWLAQFTR